MAFLRTRGGYRSTIPRLFLPNTRTAVVVIVSRLVFGTLGEDNGVLVVGGRLGRSEYRQDDQSEGQKAADRHAVVCSGGMHSQQSVRWFVVGSARGMSVMYVCIDSSLWGVVGGGFLDGCGVNGVVKCDGTQ